MRGATGIGGGGGVDDDRRGAGGGGGGAAAFAASSWKPPASVRRSESGGCLASAATSWSASAFSTWVNPSAATAKSLRSNDAFACAYFCWMIDGSMRRRTEVNAERTRGETSVSPGWIRWLGGDHRFDRLLRVGGAAERQQAERAVLLDRARLARGVIRRPQPVQHRQRVVVGGGRVQVARRGEVGVLRADAARRQERLAATNSRDEIGLHFFLKSTLRRAGVLSVTVAA